MTAWNLRDSMVDFVTDRSGGEASSMSSRFVAIDEGPDITLDRAMIVVAVIPIVTPGSTLCEFRGITAA